MPASITHRPFFAFLLLLAVACEPSSQEAAGPTDGWQGTTVEEGPTLTVRTTGGSVWGGNGRLIEEVAIGTETRGEHDLLGEVYGLDATADRIFIADAIFVMVRVYDMAGNHVRNIGRHGGGPGEFYSVTDLGIDPVREQLVVREGGGALHRLTLSGEHVGTLRPPLFGGLSGPELLLRVTRKGVPLVRHSSFRPNPAGNPPMVLTTALYTVDSTGAVTDSLDMPMHEEDEYSLRAQGGPESSYMPLPVPFGPTGVWGITWDGAIIWGNSSKYRFEIRYPDGRQTVIERETEAVRVLPEERNAAEGRVYGIMQGLQPGWAWNGPGIPDTKPFYSAIFPDRSGRIWVLREGEGRPVEGWTEPDDWREWERNPAWVPERWFDVFEEATGRYLGRVDVPEGFSSDPEPVIEGDTFICLTEDEVGRPIVRRYRLELPG
jgi:hypothetical protein